MSLANTLGPGTPPDSGPSRRVVVLVALMLLGAAVTTVVLWAWPDASSRDGVRTRVGGTSTSARRPTEVAPSTTVPPTSGDAPAATTPAATAPVAAAPGPAITFEGIAPYRIGQTGRGFVTSATNPSAGDCGALGDASTLLMVFATMTGDGGEGRVFQVETYDGRPRTATGVGVGSTLTELRAAYGSSLVEDRADGWDAPTDGLLARYTDVAAVRDGDRAITFVLGNDGRVRNVQVSTLDAWGDDEGCA